MRRWTRPLGAASLALTVAAGALVPLTLAASPASAIAAPITGVDVSSWQHPTSTAADINWSQVAGVGHDFAIIKATESTTYKNPFYASDIANARAAGMVVGAYHFARPALPLSTAQAQAKYFVATTGTMRTARTLPPVLDIEATGGLSQADTVAWAKSFLSTVKSLTGRTPMIYSYDNFLRTSLANTTTLKDYPLWYAKYSTTPPGALPGAWNTWSIWQHTSSGKVTGLKGNIDLNKFNGSAADLLRLADGTKAAPIAPGAPTDLAATLSWPDAKLVWNAPSSTGGSSITKYVVTVDGVNAGSTPTRSFVAGPLGVGTHAISVQAVTLAATGPAASLVLIIPEPEPGTLAPPAATSTVTLSTPTTVTRGSKYAVTATLRRADTQQTVVGESITIKVDAKKGPDQTYRLVTNIEGTAAAVVTPNVTTAVSTSFDGTARLTPTAAAVTVKVRPSPTASLSRSTVKKKAKVTLKGGVSSLYKGDTVRRQRYYGGKWQTLAKTKVTSSGSYTFTFKAGGKGKYSYRVLVTANALHLGGNSRTVKLKVK